MSNNEAFLNKGKLTQECCICAGQATMWACGSAFINVEDKEYRVFYHKSCLTEQTKPQIIKILNELATK